MNAVRPWLYVGKLADALYMEPLEDAGIGATLHLAHDVKHPGITSLYLAVEDGELLPAGILRRGVAFVREQKASGRSVLVACGAGISRSATFAIAALKEEENKGLLDAYIELVKVRREARPHPLLWQSLCAYYGETVPLTEMLRVCRPAPTPWR